MGLLGRASRVVGFGAVAAFDGVQYLALDQTISSKMQHVKQHSACMAFTLSAQNRGIE
jgi:hypothetical protein